MKRLLGGLLESIHMIGIALLFGAAALLTRLTSPGVFAKDLGISQETAARLFDDLSKIVGEPGRAVAVVALIAAILAPYVRNDTRKFAGWGRVVFCAGALGVLIYGWSDTGVAAWGGHEGVLDADVERHATVAEALKVRADEAVTPWNALLFMTGANLVFAAFQLFSGDAPAKPAKKKA
jgi:hypothetical protein